MKLRKLNDIFDLLENQRKNSISIFEKYLMDNVQPRIKWKTITSEPNSGFYKESNEFIFENIHKTIINYYDAKKDIFSIALKISKDQDIDDICQIEPFKG